MDPTQGDAKQNSPTEAPNAPAPGGKRANEEEILDVISGVQSQLESLRKAHAERQKALAALASQRQELESQRGDLDKKKAEIDEALGEVNLGTAKIRTQEESLRNREAELAKREVRIEAAAEHVSDHEQKAQRRVEELEQEAGRTAALREELEQVRKVSHERREQINTLEERLNASQGDESEQVSQAQAQISEAQAKIDELTAELESTRTGAAQHEAASIALRQEIEKLSSGQNGQVADREKANKEVRQLRDELVQVDKRAQLAEQRAEAAMGALDDQRGELERQVKRVQGEAATATDETSKLRFQLSELERSLDEANRGRDEERKARAETEEKLKNAPASGKGKNSKEFSALRDENAELRAKLLSAGGSGSREHTEHLDNALRESNDRIELLEGELAGARQQLSDAGDGAEAAKALNEARSEVSELESTVKLLNEQLTKTREATGQGLDPAATLRRERLSKQRTLARAQSAKVRRASEGLRDRFQQCEQILQKRAKLAEAHQAIAEKEAKIVHKNAKSGAMWLVLGMATLIGILAGVSWLIAGRVAPGMYAARAVVIADGGSRTLTADNLDSWQKYHEDLTQDPRLIETVADRLERRGMSDLAAPGDLTTVLEAGLDTQSPHAGRLELEFRGLGATHTQRVLDTYVVAMTSVANANRVRRVDGASTRVEVDAEAFPEPLDQTRLIYAGAILGGGVLFSMIVGLGAYRKMASTKARFEHDNRVDVLTDDSGWGVPERATNPPTNGR